MLDQIKAIQAKANEIEIKWSQHWEDHPHGDIILGNVDPMAGAEQEANILHTPTPVEFTNKSIADLMAIMTGEKYYV